MARLLDSGAENQGASTRVRIPDVSVFSRDIPIEQVFTRPQLIAIEVLSPEDRHTRVDLRLSNFRSFGIPNIWVVDPETRSDGNWLRREHFEVAGTPIYLSLPELFARIDEDNAD